MSGKHHHGKEHHLSQIELHASTDSHHEEEQAEGWLVSYADMMTLLVGFFVILMSFSTINNEEFEKVKISASKTFGGEYQLPYTELVRRLRAAIKDTGFGDQMILQQSDAGVAISFRGSLFFELGSADIKSTGLTILGSIIPTIKKDSEKYSVVIEGHTDDIPIETEKFHNNWELSSIRACHVLNKFEEAGFSEDQLMAVGYAATRPILPNRDQAGNPIPENQSQNRRVVIKVIKKTVAFSGAAAGKPPAAQPGKF